MDKQLALEADLAQLNAPEREEGMYRPRKKLLARGSSVSSGAQVTGGTFNWL